MKSVVSNKHVFMLLVIFSLALALSDFAWGEDANLNIVFTTTNAGGSYGTKHVHVVWIKDASGNFVYTTGSTTTDNKRALWANSRSYALKEWYNSNPTANRTADIVARTGATQTAYRTYNFNWDWRKKDGTIVPDGSYQIHFLCTNSDSGTPNNKASFSITKGSSAWSIGPVSQGGYNNISLTFTPATLAVLATAETNVLSTSATFNGEVTATDGVNPNVYIYWGTGNGGTTPENWDYEVNLGPHGVGSFSTDVVDLVPLTTYYYRCRVVTTSPAKDIWSDSVISFTTPTPEAPQINLPSSALNFEQVDIYTSKDISISIENLGKLALHINSLELIGLDNDVYSLISPPALPIVLDASFGGVVDEETVTIRFSPKSIQEYKYAKLAIGSDDPDEKIVYVDLQGVGGPDITLGTRQVGGIGGPAKALAKYNDEILLGQGAMLVLLDVSNPAQPSKINQIRLEGVIEAITVQGDVAYAALGNKGFAAVDLKNFKPLKGAATFETGGFASDIDTERNLLCIADGIAGTHLYDISIPLSPILINTYTTTGSAIAVDILRGRLCVLDESEGLRIFQPDLVLSGDLTQDNRVDMDDIAELSRGWKIDYDLSILFNVANDWLWDTTLQGTQKQYDGIEFGSKLLDNSTDIYAIDSFGNLFVIDASEEIQVESETILQIGSATDIEVQNDNAYVAGQSGLEVFDISNPTSPVSVFADSTFAGFGIVVDGTVAYLAGGSDGLIILDIGNPAAVSSLGSYSLMFAPNGVASDSLDNVYSVGDEQNLVSYNLSTSTSLSLNDIYSVIDQAEDISIENQYAYIAAGSSGLKVFDLSNPANEPYSFITEGYAKSTSVNGSNLMVSDCNEIYVLDVTIPMSPSLIGTWDTDGWAFDVAAGNAYGYIAEGNLGITILDLSNAQPVSFYPISGVAYGLEIDNDILYVAGGSSGLIIFNISDPADPVLMKEYDLPGIIVDVKKIGNRLCLADALFGVSVVDVSNPVSPELYAIAQTSAPAFHITEGSSRIYAADNKGGLAVLGVTSWPKNKIGEITGDYQVNIDDLAMLLNHWLDTESSLDILNANLNYYDTVVNIADFVVLSEFWLTNYTPPEPPELVVSNLSPSNYEILYDSLSAGATMYIDRTFTFTSVPASVTGATYIQTANNDKTTDPFSMSFDINVDCTVYVAHVDAITTPSWMSTFTDTGEDLSGSNPGGYSLYAKDFAAGTVTLGGCGSVGGEGSMYCVAVVAK